MSHSRYWLLATAILVLGPTVASAQATPDGSPSGLCPFLAGSDPAVAGLPGDSVCLRAGYSPALADSQLDRLRGADPRADLRDALALGDRRYVGLETGWGVMIPGLALGPTMPSAQFPAKVLWGGGDSCADPQCALDILSARYAVRYNQLLYQLTRPVRVDTTAP